MSASLVGSEMCIRDSPRPGSKRPWMALRAVSGHREVALRPSRSLHSKEPVSYTHLTLPTICSV
eukprot:14027884-Alexandrium_andersonii.AAC.1